MAKNRLGRGLSAILDDVEDAYRQDIESDVSVVREIPLDEIVPNQFQPRKRFDEEALHELSGSMRQHGQLQPIVVIQKDDGYMIIAGERRYRAAKMAGFDTIKAVVADYAHEKLRELALIENIQRENLSALELAHSYRELLDEYQITQEELSNIIHKSRSQITNTLRLLQLTPHTQKLLEEQKLTAGHAKILVGLDPDSEKLLADTIAGQKLSVRDSEALVKSLKKQETPVSAERSPLSATEKSPEGLHEISEKLASFGFHVKQNRNKITLTFTEDGQIKAFLSLLSSD
ncbi:MAG TPA: ParB/RepB/Spo0J family partition protein [Campylobacteraceae bacterium]|nr:ParB/RepB/Spo0J family partition protein [Campylobacteraceae bacterium]